MYIDLFAHILIRIILYIYITTFIGFITCSVVICVRLIKCSSLNKLLFSMFHRFIYCHGGGGWGGCSSENQILMILMVNQNEVFMILKLS